MGTVLFFPSRHPCTRLRRYKLQQGIRIKKIETSPYLEFNPGNHNKGETPVPIPNTEVKPFSADGTAPGAEWESRSLPGFFL